MTTEFFIAAIGVGPPFAFAGERMSVA